LPRRVTDFSRLSQGIAADDARVADAGLPGAAVEGLVQTRRGTTIASIVIAVITLLTRNDNAVAADCRAAERVAAPTSFDLATFGTAIPRASVTVVALFVRRSVAVAAGLFDAGLTGNHTEEARFGLTGRRTAIPVVWNGLAVITTLASLANPIATLRQGDTRHARFGAGEPRFSRGAVRVAAVSRVSVGVVAHLVAFNLAVATNHPTRACLTRCRAVEVRISSPAVG
jgi:hypothetical protein